MAVGFPLAVLPSRIQVSGRRSYPSFGQLIMNTGQPGM